MLISAAAICQYIDILRYNKDRYNAIWIFCISICALLINRVIPLSTWQLSDCETAKMSIKYEQLVAKPKAKSKVWKHFGFPAVASGSIIDKKKIACGYARLLYHTPVTRQTWPTIYSVSTHVSIKNWWGEVDKPGITLTSQDWVAMPQQSPYK